MVFRPESLQDRFIRVAEVQKSTLVVCADDFRSDPSGVYHHDGDMGIIAWRMAQRMFAELLSGVELAVALAGVPGAGKSSWIAANKRDGVLYLDAMLARRVTRREICRLALEAGRPIECVFIDTDLDVCLSRNAERSPDRRVPEENLRQAHHRLTVCPPGLDEGWTRIHRVGPVVEGVTASRDEVLDSAGRDL